MKFKLDLDFPNVGGFEGLLAVFYFVSGLGESRIEAFHMERMDRIQRPLNRGRATF